MKLIKFSHKMTVPACWFSLFNIIIVLLFVPIINRYVYPILDKLNSRSPYIMRMSIGKYCFVTKQNMLREKLKLACIQGVQIYVE